MREVGCMLDINPKSQITNWKYDVAPCWMSIRNPISQIRNRKSEIRNHLWEVMEIGCSTTLDIYPKSQIRNPKSIS